MANEIVTQVHLVCGDPSRTESVRRLLAPTHSVRTESIGPQTPLDPPPDLVLVVVRGGTGDWDLVKQWADAYPDLDVLALVDEVGSREGARATAVGAAAWLPATAGRDELLRAIDGFIERRRRTCRLAAEYRRCRALLDSAPIGVFEIRDGRMSYVNEHLLERLGYERDELIGRRPDMLRLVSPPERSRVQRAVEELLQQGAAQSGPHVYRFTTKSGDTYVAEVRSRLVETPDGRIIEGTIRDVTLETRMSQMQRVVTQLGEVILGESDIDRILQLVLDTITEHGGFRRAVLSLYDLSVPDPFEGEVHTTLTSGLTEDERDALLAQEPISVLERRQVFSDRYRLGPAYYIPHDDTPWTEERGISGSASVAGWNANDFLFIPLRGTAGIIGSISVDDPIDRSAPTIASIEPVAALANVAALAVERVFKMRQLQKQKEQLHGLAEFGAKLAQIHDVRTLCELAVQEVHQGMDYGVCSVFLADGMRLVQEAVAARDEFTAGEVPRKGERGHIDGPGITRWAFRNASPAIIPNVLEDERYDGPRGAIRSFMAVPIVGRKGPIGVIDVASERLAAFDAQDVAVVSTLATQISTAISALRRRDALARVYAFGQRLATASMHDQVVVGTLDFLVEQFDFELSGILLVGEDGQLEVAGLRGLHQGGVVRVGTQFPMERGIVGWVAKNRRPLLVPDVSGDSRYVEAFAGIRSELAVPILFAGNLLGVINVESQQPAFFDEEDRQLLEVVANHLAIALSNLSSQDILREQAIRDPLTALYNRHYFHSIVASELSRADRYGRSLSVMMIDIDGFRAVNNEYGHLRGDEVLREIARMLKESVRSSDRVIRYGGDEFLVLMPESDVTGDSAAVAERLRVRIREIPHRMGITGHSITLSIGVYTRSPGDGRTLEAILEEVDRRMYADKRGKPEHGDHR